MYSRKTRNKILASILLLVAVMSIPQNNSIYADTSVTDNVFSPWSFYFTAENIYSTDEIPPYVSSGIKLDSVKPNVVPTVPEEQAPESHNNKVLIYHTHTTEAYLADESSRYTNLAGRSDNAALTVESAGEALQNAFAEFGTDSDHDRTNNEALGYNNAYTTAYASVDKMIAENGGYMAYLDVHRDAYVSGTTPTVTVNGKSVAKIMLVVGGKSPHSEQNYRFAQKIMTELNKIHPLLCEKVLMVTNSRYNTIESDNCVIVEIGDNNVTVEEAKNASHLIAEAVNRVLNGQAE